MGRGSAEVAIDEVAAGHSVSHAAGAAHATEMGTAKIAGLETAHVRRGHATAVESAHVRSGHSAAVKATHVRAAESTSVESAATPMETSTAAVKSATATTAVSAAAPVPAPAAMCVNGCRSGQAEQQREACQPLEPVPTHNAFPSASRSLRSNFFAPAILRKTTTSNARVGPTYGHVMFGRSPVPTPAHCSPASFPNPPHRPALRSQPRLSGQCGMPPVPPVASRPRPKWPGPGANRQFDRIDDTASRPGH